MNEPEALTEPILRLLSRYLALQQDKRIRREMTMRKKLGLGWVLLATWSLSSTTWAWKPPAWSWFSWPYAYDLVSMDWYWFHTAGDPWTFGLPPAGGWQLMRQSGLAEGWSWWGAWPYVYDHEHSAWYYFNESAAPWLVNARTGQWSLLGRREARPLDGCCYGPFRDGQAPGVLYPTTDELKADVFSIERLYGHIRTYGNEESLREIPALCAEAGLDCYPGAWIDSDQRNNARQISNLVAIARARQPTTRGLIVGNEVLLRGSLSREDLIAHIQAVRSATDLPVTTAEPWHIWLMNEHADLAGAVDFIMIHVHPFWEGIPVDQAAAYVTGRWAQVSARWPGKKIVLGETGWPTAGTPRGAAIPGEAQQTAFLRAFAPLAAERGITWFFFEAFDEAWKAQQGDVESHWGLGYSDRLFKPALTDWLTHKRRARSSPMEPAPNP